VDAFSMFLIASNAPGGNFLFFNAIKQLRENKYFGKIWEKKIKSIKLLIKKNIKACFNPKIKSFLTNIFKNV
jgi:hypothetical protein